MKYADVVKKAKYKSDLQKDPESFLLLISSGTSVRGVLVQLYHELVNEGKCTKIEDLTPEEKDELLEEAKRISVKQEKNYLIEAQRALHGFGTFVQL